MAYLLVLGAALGWVLSFFCLSLPSHHFLDHFFCFSREDLLQNVANKE